jgi:hypothetical protein
LLRKLGVWIGHFVDNSSVSWFAPHFEHLIAFLFMRSLQCGHSFSLWCCATTQMIAIGKARAKIVIIAVSMAQPKSEKDISVRMTLIKTLLSVLIIMAKAFR